jgi:hypothetical protein
MLATEQLASQAAAPTIVENMIAFAKSERLEQILSNGASKANSRYIRYALFLFLISRLASPLTPSLALSAPHSGGTA